MFSILNNYNIESMDCSSLVSVAIFSPGDPGSNPGWFAVWNSNPKIEFTRIIQAYD